MNLSACMQDENQLSRNLELFKSENVEQLELVDENSQKNLESYNDRFQNIFYFRHKKFKRVFCK